MVVNTVCRKKKLLVQMFGFYGLNGTLEKFDPLNNNNNISSHMYAHPH